MAGAVFHPVGYITTDPQILHGTRMLRVAYSGMVPKLLRMQCTMLFKDIFFHSFELV